jgi:hypothetical protein
LLSITILVLNTPVQRLKVAILPLDLACSEPVAHSGDILTTGKSHGKKPDRFSLNDDTDAKKVSRFKYRLIIGENIRQNAIKKIMVGISSYFETKEL